MDGGRSLADWVMISVPLSFVQRELKFLRRCGNSSPLRVPKSLILWLSVLRIASEARVPFLTNAAMVVELC